MQTGCVLGQVCTGEALIALVFSCSAKSSGKNNLMEHVALIKKQETHIFEIQSHRALPPRQMCALLPPIRKRWDYLKGHLVLGD